MLNGNGAKPPPKHIEEIYEEASASVAAETLLAAMGPQLEKALEFRISELFKAKPELGELLDCRAQLKSVWEIRKGLIDQKKRGAGAVEMMNKLLVSSL